MPTPTGSSRARRRSTLRPRLDDLENRCLLSASIYTVNSTANGTSGSGDSGTLPYVIGLANTDPNVDGSEIQFSPAVFSSPQTITLANTLALLESPGPERDRGARGGADDLGRRAIVELQRLFRRVRCDRDASPV